MALLNYKDPRSNIIYGEGNKNISTADIRNYVNNMPNKTPEAIRDAMLANNVSISQLSNAMGNNAGFNTANLEKHAGLLGIGKEIVAPESSGSVATPQAVKAPDPVQFTPVQAPPLVQFTPVQAPPPVTPKEVVVTPRETVLGQINNFVADRNHPLNVQAETMAKQYANKRGLLDSSIELSAIQDATLKNAMPMAAQDAQTYYDSLRTNSGQALQADISNADRSLQAGMFNSGKSLERDVFNTDAAFKTGAFNAEKGLQSGMFNADQSLRGGMFNAELGRDLYMNDRNLSRDYFIANLDADIKTKIANINAMSAETGYGVELYRNTMNEVARILQSDMPRDAKNEAVNSLLTMQENGLGLLKSIGTVSSGLAEKLGFSPVAKQAGGSSVAVGAATPSAGSPEGTVISRADKAAAVYDQSNPERAGNVYPKADGNGYIVKAKQGLRPFDLDTSSLDLDVNDLANISALEQNTGRRIDPQDVVPQSTIAILQPSYIDLGDAYVPIPVPGSRRADNVLLYIWKAALPKYQ